MNRTEALVFSKVWPPFLAVIERTPGGYRLVRADDVEIDGPELPSAEEAVTFELARRTGLEEEVIIARGVQIIPEG